MARKGRPDRRHPAPRRRALTQTCDAGTGPVGGRPNTNCAPRAHRPGSDRHHHDRLAARRAGQRAPSLRTGLGTLGAILPRHQGRQPEPDACVGLRAGATRHHHALQQPGPDSEAHARRIHMPELPQQGAAAMHLIGAAPIKLRKNGQKTPGRPRFSAPPSVGQLNSRTNPSHRAWRAPAPPQPAEPAGRLPGPPAGKPAWATR